MLSSWGDKLRGAHAPLEGPLLPLQAISPSLRSKIEEPSSIDR
jgi:hypothetical protein